MRRNLPILTALLLLGACGQPKDQTPAPVEDAGSPQIATSIDDELLPLDRSDQITAIDAATGDARGMPREGGGVVKAAQPKPPAPVPAASEAPATGALPASPAQPAAPAIVTPVPPPPAQ
ncbi:MAG: hypothetical protein ACOY5R_21270 [Pseudomonadota bacterium]|uniref:hypothetical protein n=1 Tax=Rhizorhabdus phycosphaerae TaxID=2711156 RepID=UPI0013EAE433|nr:hypothetical protein [Rhizorhabdus phycosphaerae]